MESLLLHEFHANLGARFTELGGAEVVLDYGDALKEHAALRESAGILDLSFRSRLCLVGADRVRFLHGQVTNDINRLQPGQGCYAALVTAKGKMQSDLCMYCLEAELLLDFEPGLAQSVTERLEKHIVADEVQVVDVGSQYGLLSAQGPEAGAIVGQVGLVGQLPLKEYEGCKAADQSLGEVYVMNNPRLGTAGFDLFVPSWALAQAAERLLAAAHAKGGRACGWTALETARVEAGRPRFGIDMDESNLPLEAGLAERAISFQKGCYIGQEVLNRIHTIGHTTKELRGLRLAGDAGTLPRKGDKLEQAGKEVGYITSAVRSPALGADIALGYVRREAGQPGTELTVRAEHGPRSAKIQELPFR